MAPSPPQAPPSPDDYANLPLEDLARLIDERSASLQQALADRFAPKESPMNAPGPADVPSVSPAAEVPAKGAALAAPAPVAAPVDDGMGVPPADVKAATAVLVGAGMLPTATDQLTPEVLAALRTFADQVSPGLYNLEDPVDLEEFVHGIANGSIAPAGGGAGPAGPPVDPAALALGGGAPPV